MLLRLMFSDICNEGPPDKPMNKTVSLTACSAAREEHYCTVRRATLPRHTQDFGPHMLSSRITTRHPITMRREGSTTGNFSRL